MKVYIGVRLEELRCAVAVYSDGKEGLLNPRLDLRQHSPSGFEWGYAGAGPAQLALALLADATGDERVALHLYQSFKFNQVVRLPKEGWALSAEQILLWVAEELGNAMDRAVWGPEEEGRANG